VVSTYILLEKLIKLKITNYINIQNMLDSYSDRPCPNIIETVSILSCAFVELYPNKDDVLIRNIVTHHVSNKEMEGSYSSWAMYYMPELKKAIKTDIENTE